jgi:simple sugar transport system permease protein
MLLPGRNDGDRQRALACRSMIRYDRARKLLGRRVLLPSRETRSREGRLQLFRGPEWLLRLGAQQEASIVVIAVLLAGYFQLSNSAFLTSANLQTVAAFAAAAAMVAAGEVFLLVCGEIDLSAGQVFALAPFVVHALLDWRVPLTAAVALAVAGSCVVGLVNGLVTLYLRLPSFITTLGTLYIVSGLTLHISGGGVMTAPTNGLAAQVFGLASYSQLAWALGIIALLHVTLTRTRWGLHTIATGGNIVAASETGINTRRLTIRNFMLCSALAGFAGITDSIRIGSVDPLAGGTTVMFAAIAAAVIGGTALAGGSGTVLGAMLGALVLGILRDGFTLQGVGEFSFDLIVGVAILIAMAVNVQVGALRSGRLVRRQRKP